jgi:hypothetical protein
MLLTRYDDGEGAFKNMTTEKGRRPMESSVSVDLPVEQRMQVFRDVVGLQDQAFSVALSRKEVAKQHGIGEDAVKAIEREGISQQWPPL